MVHVFADGTILDHAWLDTFPVQSNVASSLGVRAVVERLTAEVKE